MIGMMMENLERFCASTVNSIHDRTLQIAQRDVAGGKCVNISTVGTLVSL